MKDYTEIVCILDRSGSMRNVINDAIGGFNQFLADQKSVPGDAVMTIVYFDDRYDLVVARQDIQQVEPIDISTYSPRGMTALYDALGRTINKVGFKLAALPESERPSRVIIATLTDGEENASKDYTEQRLREMIDHQSEVYSWEFVFLASDLGAIREAVALGINPNNMMSFEQTGDGYSDAYCSLSASIKSFRLGGDSSFK